MIGIHRVEGFGERRRGREERRRILHGEFGVWVIRHRHRCELGRSSAVVSFLPDGLPVAEFGIQAREEVVQIGVGLVRKRRKWDRWRKWLECGNRLGIMRVGSRIRERVARCRMRRRRERGLKSRAARLECRRSVVDVQAAAPSSTPGPPGRSRMSWSRVLCFVFPAISIPIARRPCSAFSRRSSRFAPPECLERSLPWR